MKRMVTGLVALSVSLILAFALAQGMMGEPGNQNQRMPGMMGGTDMGQMQEQMQQMVGLCTDMMQQMPGMMGMMMGSGMMGSGMMQPDVTAQHTPADAEILARAFLAGHAPGAEIVEVEPEDGAYMVSFRHGDTQGTLRVDANTGEVQLAEQQ